MSKELEELKKQKREIEKRIKELTCPLYSDENGIVKLFANQRRGEPTGNWTVTIRDSNPVDWQRSPQNKVLISAKSKEEAVMEMYNLIFSLQWVVGMADKDGAVARKMRGEQ